MGRAVRNTSRRAVVARDEVHEMATCTSAGGSHSLPRPEPAGSSSAPYRRGMVSGALLRCAVHLLGSQARSVVGCAAHQQARLLLVAVLPAAGRPANENVPAPGNLPSSLQHAVGTAVPVPSCTPPAKAPKALPPLNPATPEAHAQGGHVCLLDVVALGAKPPVLGVHPVHLHLQPRQPRHTLALKGRRSAPTSRCTSLEPPVAHGLSSRR